MSDGGRASLPWSLWAAATLWGGAIVGWEAGEPAGLTIAGILAVFGGLSMAMSRSTGLRVVLIVLMSFSIGTVRGALYHGAMQRGIAYADLPSTQVILARVVSDPVDTYRGTRSEAVVEAGAIEGVRLDVYWPADLPAPAIGQMISARAFLRSLPDSPMGADRLRSGIVAQASVKAIDDARWASGFPGVLGRLRQRAARLIGDMEGSGAPLVASVVIADRTDIRGTGLEDDLRMLGLSHLIAVSGTHLMVLSAGIDGLLQRVGAGRRIRSLLVSATLGCYVLAIGAPASAIRALTMYGFVAFGGGMGRRSSRVHALALCVMALLLLDPGLAFDLGFRLSVLAVLGITLFSTPIDSWLRGFGVFPRAIAHPLALTLAAQIATLPLVIPLTGSLPLISPIANLLAMPLVVVMLGFGMSAVCVAPVIPAIAVGGFRVAAWAGDVLAAGAHALATVPGGVLPVGVRSDVLAAVILAVTVGAWVVRPRIGRKGNLVAIVMIVVAVAAEIPAPSKPSLVVLDVGQGDAILIRDGHRTLLVDTGPSPTALRTALGRQGVYRLDGVVLTHLHNDHSGGITALKGLQGPRTVHVPEGTVTASDASADAFFHTVESLGVGDIREIGFGSRIRAGSIAIDMIWPDVPGATSGENESSTILLGRRGSASFLLTGDAESDGLNAISSFLEVADLDVLKVGHHGSKHSVDPPSLGILRPRIAAISVGEGNRFGHPSEEALTALSASGCRIDRTDRQGDLVYLLDD